MAFDEKHITMRSTEGHGWGQHGPQEPWLAARQKIHQAAMVRYAACLGALVMLFIVVNLVRVIATKSRLTGNYIFQPFTILSRFVPKITSLPVDCVTNTA